MNVVAPLILVPMIEEGVVVIEAGPRTGTGAVLVTREKGEVDRERKREVEVDREKRKKGVDQVKEKVLWVNEKGKVEVDHVNERKEVDQETKKGGVDPVNEKEKVGVDHVNEREVEVDLVIRRGGDLGVGLMTGGRVIPEIGTEGEVIEVDLLIDLVIIDTDPILVVVPEAEKEVKKRMIHPKKRDQE